MIGRSGWNEKSAPQGVVHDRRPALVADVREAGNVRRHTRHRRAHARGLGCARERPPVLDDPEQRGQELQLEHAEDEQQDERHGCRDQERSQAAETVREEQEQDAP